MTSTGESEGGDDIDSVASEEELILMIHKGEVDTPETHREDTESETVSED